MILRTLTILVIDVLVLACIFLAKPSMSQGKGHDDLQICIVGAGIGGASAAHFLSQSTDFKGRPLRIVIFERKGSVGGRIATTQFNGGGSAEAGASIIASRNRLMSHFVDFLNLTRISHGNDTLGLWDGKQYRLVTSKRPAVTAAKFLTRYKKSIFEMRRLMNDLLDRFDNLYPRRFVINQWRASETVESLFAPTKGLYDLTQMRFDALVKGKLSNLFLDEMASAISRANYNQEASEMNALAGAVSLAGSGGMLWGVKEGNVQVVHGLIERSGAELVLNTEIKGIVNSSTEKRAISHYILNSKSGMTWQCDGVIIAAPLELTTVSLPDSLSHSPVHGRKFQTTIASFVEGALNKRTFGRWAPDGTLTIAGSEKDFSSCSVVHKIDKHTAIYKVFSKRLLSNNAIERLFEPGAKIKAIHSWKAYPKFSPPERFARFALDDDGALYYTSPIESGGSAMEMSAISGANAAALIFKKLKLRLRNEEDRNKDEL